MFVVVQGEIEVVKASPRGDLVLARLGQGDFVGEMSLLESPPRSATARACGATKLLAIHPGGFLVKIRRDPTFAFEVMQTLSRRIRTTNESLIRELAESSRSEGHQLDSIKAIIQGAEFQPQPELETSPGFQVTGSGS
jgi:CRP-like cAMP-binding protein